MSFPGEGLLSGIVGGALNYYGAREANKANREMAREQMGFQERMSNTSYQRAMMDMKAAGLNLILAYQQGGASTPGGSTATMKNEMAPAISTAMEARRMSLELENMKAVNQRTKAETQAIINLLPENALRGRSAQGLTNIADFIKERGQQGISSAKSWYQSLKDRFTKKGD